MKRKSLIILSFLLFLYIVPVILAPSSMESPRQNNQNMTKDFSAAEYGDESPQSITSFSETLEDDVLFFPDAMQFLAVGGNATAESGGTYASTHTSNNVNWYAESTITGASYTYTFQLNFETNLISAVEVEYFFERQDGTGTFDEGGIQLYNFTSSTWGFIYEDEDWHGAEVSRTIEVSSSDYIGPEGDVYLRVTMTLTDGGAGTDVGVYVDFCRLSFLSGSGYIESFADVSDWSDYGISGDDIGIVSDGDIGTIECAASGNDDSDGAFTNEVSLTITGSYYMECRVRANYTSVDYLYISLWNQDSGTGTGQHINVNPVSINTWVTFKALVTLAAVESIYYRTRIDIGETVRLDIDYLRISPADEMGWQHDMSTTSGITAQNGASVSSDGDLLSVVNDAASDVLFNYDSTATAAYMAPDYYPFVELCFDATSIGNKFAFDSYAGGQHRVLQAASSTIAQTTYRYNLRASSGSDSVYLRLYGYDSQTVKVDYVKFYSIANYTLTLTGTSSDDVLYVDSDTLYCQGTSFTSIVLDRDPALSVSTTYIYRTWNMSTSIGTPQVDFYISAWLGYSSETSGELIAGTLTDIRIKFTASANIISITFIDSRFWHEISEAILQFDMPNWHLIATAIIRFVMPLDMTTINWLLIFFGMCLIPTSTVYLVYGGRKSFSTDKLFYGLIAFFMGWALLLGGIYA